MMCLCQNEEGIITVSFVIQIFQSTPAVSVKIKDDFIKRI